MLALVVYVYANEISNRRWKSVAAGLAISKLLPADPKLKILGLNNRLLYALANAAFFAIVEIILVMAPKSVWVYP